MKNINKKIALILTLSLTVNATDYDGKFDYRWTRRE